MTAAENLSKYSGLSWPGGDLACWKQSVCLAHNYLPCIHSSADLDTWQVLLDKQQEEHISSPAHRAPANDRAGALPWRSIEMMSVPVVYLYIWSLINVGVDNGAGQTGYWYVGCSSPYIRLSDCRATATTSHLILNLNPRWGKNTANAHRSKLHWNSDALQPYLGYTSLHWYKCKCKGGLHQIQHGQC